MMKWLRRLGGAANSVRHVRSGSIGVGLACHDIFLPVFVQPVNGLLE
jgi:hypothetical protein